MKTIKTTIAILALSIFTICFASSLLLVSCSKDDAPPPAPVVIAPEQNPLPGFLATTGYNQQTNPIINGTIFEQGFSFIPLVNGKITTIVVQLPAIKTDLRVTVWDKANSSILLTEIINIPAANTEITKNITALNLIKDKEYIISFSSDDYYLRSKTDQSAVTYPITIGDIKVTNYLDKSGSSQTMPTIPRNTGFFGDCSFKFQK